MNIRHFINLVETTNQMIIFTVDGHSDTLPLSQFFADNSDGIDVEEQHAIRQALNTEGYYVGGGGAYPEWKVSVATNEDSHLEHPEDNKLVSRSEVVADVYANKITGEMMCIIKGFDKDIARWEGDEDMIKMFEADKAYGEKCLATFGQDDDFSRLWYNLLDQDTAARDRYSAVFDLILAALNDLDA